MTDAFAAFHGQCKDRFTVWDQYKNRRSAKEVCKAHTQSSGPVSRTWIPRISLNQQISGCSGKGDILMKVLEL